MPHLPPDQIAAWSPNQKLYIPRAIAAVINDVNGVPYDVSHENPLAVMNLDVALAVQRGFIDGAQLKNVFARNPDVDATEEDIWEFGGSYTYLTSASQIRFASTSILDNGVTPNTGARTGLLRGLDANYLEISETITLNGTANVDSVNSYLRVESFVIQTAGTGGTTAGNINITSVTGSFQQAFIAAGNNETRLSQYTIPAGMTAYLKRFYFNQFAVTGSTKVANVQLMIREFGKVFTSLRALDISDVHIPIELPMYEIPEKSDIVMRAACAQTNAIVSGGYDLLCFTN